MLTGPPWICIPKVSFSVPGPDLACVQAIMIALYFCAVNGDIVDWLQSAFTIHVEDGDFFNTGRIINREQGDILVSYDWTSHHIEV